jgi:hypothetical protein
MAAPLFIDGTPIYWNNHSLFHYAATCEFETIEDALTGISDAFISMSARKSTKMTPQVGVVLARMFDAAIETGYFMLGESRPHNPTLPFDFAVNPQAIEILMQLFIDSTSPKKGKAEEKKS